MASLTREALVWKLDKLRLTPVNYRDPVDGSEVPCLEIQQVAFLVNHYEERLLEAVQTRPIKIEVETDEGQRKLMRIAVEQERAAILEMLQAASSEDALDSYTLGTVIARIKGRA